MLHEMDRLFGTTGLGTRRLFAPARFPAVHLWEDAESFYVEAELPDNVDAHKVEAQLSLGVLTIRLPKREESKPRRIEIKAE